MYSRMNRAQNIARADIIHFDDAGRPEAPAVAIPVEYTASGAFSYRQDPSLMSHGLDRILVAVHVLATYDRRPGIRKHRSRRFPFARPHISVHVPGAHPSLGSPPWKEGGRRSVSS
jgi:hypothetical protein